MDFVSVKEELTNLFPQKAISCIGQGASSVAFEIDDNIIRIPKADTSRYLKEEQILPTISKYVHPHTPIIHIVKKPIFYSIHKKLNGNDWDLNTYDALSATQKNLFCGDIATFFLQLHSIPLKKLSPGARKILKPYSLPTENQLKHLLNGIFTAEESHNLYQYAKRISKPQGKIIFAHKDFRRKNSLVDHNHRLTAVFDYGNACLGEGAEDFKPLCNPDYLPILKKALKYYNQYSNDSVSFKRIVELQEIECFFVIKYLGSYPQIKKERGYEWNVNIRKLKSILKKLNKGVS